MKDKRIVALCALLFSMKHHPEWSPEKMVRLSISKCKAKAKSERDFYKKELDRINGYNEAYGRIENDHYLSANLYQHKKVKRYIDMGNKEQLSYDAIYELIKKYLIDPIGRTKTRQMR